MATFKVRDARRDDCKEIRRLIQELADFEKMPDGPQLNAKDLERDAFDIKPPLYSAFVVDDPNDSSKLIGMAIYFYAYSSVTGRKMYLEDLYVAQAFRGKGVGNLLFQRVVQKGLEMNCVNMQFVVLDWNPAQDFYKARGSRDLTKEDSVHLYRLDNEFIKTSS